MLRCHHQGFTLPCFQEWGAYAWAGWIVALVSAVAGLQAQPNPGEGYLGAEACAVCHRENYESQSRTGHAEALFPVAEHPLFQEIFSGAEWSRPPNSRFEFTASADGVTVRVSHGEREVRLPIEWAFGSGDQGITFVSQLENERYVEYSFTWYAAIESLALTAGHPDREPASLTQAIGNIYDVFSVPATIMACFQCHSTGPAGLGDRFEIRPAELGVRCEACHGPGQQHVSAVKQGDLDRVKASITNPATLPPERINDSCGTCHRVPAAEGREFDFSNAWHVRHQPPYLSQSRCFRESGALTCFTCHDPHEKLKRGAPEHYNARCASCHDAVPHPNIGSAAAAPMSDCIACHMPKVQPQLHLTFTNHWIGVYGQSKLRPRE
jgi:hypothetical protein